MPTALLRAVLAAILILVLEPLPAHADVYTWTDASGRVNVSNLEPPEGVRVTNVIQTSKDAARDEAMRAAARESARQAEVQALADRVRMLQDEVEFSRRMPPPMAMAGPPPMMQYATDWMPPPPVQYAAPPPPAYGPAYGPGYGPAYGPGYAGCDLVWASCPWGLSGVAYPASIVIVRTPVRPRHQGHGGFRSGGGQAPAPPIRGSPGGGLRMR